MADDDKKKDDKNEGMGAKAGDLFFKSRTVLITGEINEKLANRVSTQLIALAEDSDDPIDVFISSPGGHVESGDMVHDMITFIKPTVRCIGSGWVASAGALIFVGAKKENRFCLPNTRFLLHEPRGGVGGQVTDIQIQAKQIEIMRERFHRIFAKATGQTEKRIATDTHRDFWLTTKEAIDYGLVSKVIKTANDLK